MAFADDLAAMQDAVYAQHGIPVTWTPAGGPSVGLTALPALGDKNAPIGGFSGSFVVGGNIIKVRERERAALAPTYAFAAGDHIDLADGTNGYRIEGAPSRQDDRRTEWTIELAAS